MLKSVLGITATFLLIWSSDYLSPALSQGFMVEPMRMEASVPAGRTVEFELLLRSRIMAGPSTVNIRVVELAQLETGSIAPLRLEEGEFPPENSLVDHITLSSETFDIQPMETARIAVRANMPPGRRGIQTAGLIIESAPDSNGSSGAVSVRVRFLVPLILSVEGAPARAAVQLDELGLEQVEPDSVNASTEIVLGFSNSGNSLPRVQGSARLEIFQGGRWRNLNDFTPREMGVLPGASIRLRHDLERRLPSGTYRLSAGLTVDGRRLAPVVKEFEFVGDPEADALALGTELELSETELSMDVVPGARRTSVLRLNNYGTNPVEVSLAPRIPLSLLGVQSEGLLGTDLSAANWVDFQPRNFTLRAGGTQNIRVVGAVPSDAPPYPNFYSDMQISARFVDGQGAGELSALVHLHNNREQDRVSAVIDQFVLSELGDNAHALSVRIANMGNVHLQPSVRAALIEPGGNNVWDVALTGDTTKLLPLGMRVFGGELDFSSVPSGQYVLRASGSVVSTQLAASQRVIEVSDDENGNKTLRIIEDADPEALEMTLDEEVN